MLGTLKARGFVDQNSQCFASTIKDVGKQAGIGLMHRAVDIDKLSSLGRDEYIHSVSF